MTRPMLSTISVLTFAAGLAAATPAAAQLPIGSMPARRLVRLGFGGGMSVPTSRAADVLKNGINGQAFLLIDTGVLPPLRFNLGYQQFDFEEAVLGGGTGHSSTLSGVGGLSVDLFRLGPLRSYVTAGLGAFRIADLVKDDAGVSSSSANVRFGIDGGGGLAIKLGRLDGFIEARIQNVYTEAGVIDTKTIRSVPVTFGLLY